MWQLRKESIQTWCGGGKTLRLDEMVDYLGADPTFTPDFPDGAAGAAGEVDVGSRVVTDQIFLCELGRDATGSRVAFAVLVELVDTVAGHTQQVRNEILFRAIEGCLEYEAWREIACLLKYDAAGKVES